MDRRSWPWGVVIGVRRRRFRDEEVENLDSVGADAGDPERLKIARD